MRTWLILISLSLACAQSDFTLLSEEERANTHTIRITEVRKVSRQSTQTSVPGDFPHRDHDVKIVLEDHPHFADVKRWLLAFMRGEEQFTSAFDVQENVGSEQKEIVFPTELIPKANVVFITARDAAGSTVAYGSAQFKIPDLNSNLAWVGRAYDPSASFLRVDTGTLPVVEIGSHVCKQNTSPCYILKESLPEVIPRCLNLTDSITDEHVVLCDETMVPYHRLSSSVTADFKEDDELLLSLTPPQTEVVKSIEVVAYNPRDPSTVYSPDDSQCSPQGGKGAPGQVECSQNLRMTERVDTIEFIVVVFMSQNESQPESILLKHGFIVDDGQTQTGVIIAAIIGVLFVVALIAAIVICIRKNKSKGNHEVAMNATTKYTSAPTSDPEPA